jgi:glycosyltransferase involved in cell wall biosynthesis
MPPTFLSIVVPAYNEERRLPRTLPRAIEWLRSQPWDWELRVADDGSTDGTAEVVTRFANEEPRVVLQREPHRGKGGAVRAGMQAATGQWRFLADADFSMPVEEVARFLPPRAVGWDLLIGVREGPGAARVGEPSSRHTMGRVFNGLVRAALVPGVSDSQCGFKCFAAHTIPLLFDRSRIDGFAFDVEVLFLARQAGLRITEVPIPWWYMDTSKVQPLRDTRRMVTEVARIRWNAWRGRY